MPSVRKLVRGSSVLVVALAGVAVAFAGVAATFAGVAAAQSPGAGSGLGLGTRIGIRFVAALVVNLLFGGALVAFGPRYAAETVTELRRDPGGAFGWGLVVGLLVPFVLALLAITIVGLVVAVPGGLLLAVIALVGHAVTVVWLGNALVGDDGEVGGTDALVGAVALAVPVSIPVLGNLVNSFVGLFGTGVVGRGVYESWRG